MEKQLINMQKQLTQKDQTIANLKKQLQESQSSDAIILRAEIETLKAQLAEEDIKKEKIESQIQVEANLLRKQLDEMKEALEEQQNENARLQKEAKKPSQIPQKGQAKDRKTTPMTGNIKGLAEENQKLRNQMVVLTKEKGLFQAKITRLEEELSGHCMSKDQEEEMRRELDRRRELNENLQKQVYSLIAEVKRSEERARIAEDALEEKEAAFQEMSSSTNTRLLEYQALQDENTQLMENMKQKDQIINDLNEEITEIRREFEDMKNQNTDMNRQIMSSETENETIVQKLNEKSRECESLRCKLEQEKATNAELQNTVAKAKKENAVLNEDLRANISAIEAQNVETEQMKEELNEKQELIAQLQKQVATLTQQGNDLEALNAELSAQNSELAEIVAQNKEELLNYESTVKTQENKILVLQDTIITKDDDRRKLELHYNDLRTSMASSHDEKVSSYLAKIEQQRLEISNQSATIEKLRSQLADSKSQCSDMNNRSKSLKQEYSEVVDKYDALVTKHEQLEDALSAANLKNNQSQDQIEKMKARIANLEHEIKTSDEQIAAITTENMQLREHVDQLTVTADQFAGASDELRQHKVERDKLVATINQGKTKIEQLEKVTESLHMEIEALLADKRSLQNKLKKNEEDVKAFVATYDEEVHGYEQKIEAEKLENKRMASQIRELQRKIADDSEEKNLVLSRRVMELENQVNSMIRNPSYSAQMAKNKTNEEEIQRLNAKVVALESERERILAKSAGKSAEFLQAQMLRRKLSDLEKANDKLKLENRSIVNGRVMAEAQLEEMQKRLDQEKHERDQIIQRIADIISRKSIAKADENVNTQY